MRPGLVHGRLGHVLEGRDDRDQDRGLTVGEGRLGVTDPSHRSTEHADLGHGRR